MYGTQTVLSGHISHLLEAQQNQSPHINPSTHSIQTVRLYVRTHAVHTARIRVFDSFERASCAKVFATLHPPRAFHPPISLSPHNAPYSRSLYVVAVSACSFCIRASSSSSRGREHQKQSAVYTTLKL